MVFMEAQENGEDGFALWTLFAREDVPKLNEFLKEKFGGFDPISNGDVEINDELFAEIWSKLAIQPYIIHQRAGQAVIIPALAPHYVRPHSRHHKFWID